MSLDAGYAIWSGAFAALLSLLLGIIVVKGVKHVKRVFAIDQRYPLDAFNHADAMQDVEHRALVFLMNQKTDSILDALGKTIERERQKLGMVVRNPSIEDVLPSEDRRAPMVAERPVAVYERVMPLVQSGTSIKSIASELDLSEAEVSLIMRSNAA